MSSEVRTAGRIYVNGVEKRSDREVEIIFKEDYLVRGEPKGRYLRQLLEKQGIKVQSGEQIGATPFMTLYAARDEAPLMRAEVVRVFSIDHEIELSPQIFG